MVSFKLKTRDKDLAFYIFCNFFREVDFFWMRRPGDLHHWSIPLNPLMSSNISVVEWEFNQTQRRFGQTGVWVCERKMEEKKVCVEGVITTTLRHSEWHHTPSRHGGQQENKIGRHGLSRQREGGWKGGERGVKRRRGRAGAEETLEKTACKYANSGSLKWRWRGDGIKSSEHCVIMDQFAAIKPPYGWSLWNGEISAPQGRLWWRWRSQTMGVTEGDESGKDWKPSAGPPSACRPGLKGFLIMLMVNWCWHAGLWPSLTTPRREPRRCLGRSSGKLSYYYIRH